MSEGVIERVGSGAHGVAVLVTGARGFVGRALVPLLAKSGYRVIAASREPAGAVPDGAADIRRLPSPDKAPDAAFDALLEGVDHIVHLAAIAHTRLSAEESKKAYHQANFLLTKRLADAAARSLPGKMVYVSSSRAQCGASFRGVLTEHAKPEPVDDYGRTKLAGEIAVANALTPSHFSILRPVLVYGPGVGGNLATLARLAALPMPLPFAALTARRSLVDRDALCRAVLHCMESQATDGGTFLVADAHPLAVSDIVVALRHGLGRPSSLFVLPSALLAFAATLAGQGAKWETLSRDLIASSSHLAATGWKPQTDTMAALRNAMKQNAT
ncbi:NAD-dependent epimerase/dehydratase family protein [Rhizobium sp. RU36D]|uniref:NAD-dependent epimerase/dehydratase family protein n=1 Tax=Rhizobium sp. RU36D TaxID=1907415 RepID=UPI0009D8008F|nr:NAD-dependent epimerase/dehydratase family protein [Rhizobium sp. RU36D]SMC44646.1 UDP-glucose 4-epimerase [Rhizobium sp. RU36D]